MEPYGYRYIKTSNPYLYCRTEIFSGSSLNLGRVRSRRKKIDGPKKMGEMNASLPNKESAFLPRILEVERTKVIPQTALPVPNHVKYMQYCMVWKCFSKIVETSH